MIKDLIRLLRHFEATESESIAVAKGKHHLDKKNPLKTIKKAWQVER